MRIIDENNKNIIDSVLIMLTEKEARELSNKIASINPEEGDHIHVNNLQFTRQISVLIYTPQNLQFFSEDIRKTIVEGDD